jgi:hypothetical protein
LTPNKNPQLKLIPKNNQPQPLKKLPTLPLLKGEYGIAGRGIKKPIHKHAITTPNSTKPAGLKLLP